MEYQFSLDDREGYQLLHRRPPQYEAFIGEEPGNGEPNPTYPEGYYGASYRDLPPLQEANGVKKSYQ